MLDAKQKLVLNTRGGKVHEVIRLPEYFRRLKSYRRIEPALDDAVLLALTQEFDSGPLTWIPGTGGWFKVRVASPSRNIGKSGGFRAICLAYQARRRLFLYTVYDHREKADLSPQEKATLKKASDDLQGAHRE